MSISPSMRTAGLPEPLIRANAKRVNLDEIFVVRDNTGITVTIDEIIQAIRLRDEAVAETVQQANVIVEENNKLQEALVQQSAQVESVRSRLEVFQAGLGTTAPEWADIQLDNVLTGFDAIVTPLEPGTLQHFEPLSLPDEVLLLPEGPTM